MVKKVKIAEFKSRLSEHLRSVRRGDDLVILDRDRPVAKVSSYSEEDGGTDFLVRTSRIKGDWKGLKWPSQKIDVDVVRILREDRDKR